MYLIIYYIHHIDYYYHYHYHLMVLLYLMMEQIYGHWFVLVMDIVTLIIPLTYWI